MGFRCVVEHQKILGPYFFYQHISRFETPIGDSKFFSGFDCCKCTSSVFWIFWRFSEKGGQKFFYCYLSGSYSGLYISHQCIIRKMCAATALERKSNLADCTYTSPRSDYTKSYGASTRDFLCDACFVIARAISLMESRLICNGTGF